MSSKKQQLIERWKQKEWLERYYQLRGCWLAGIDLGRFSPFVPKYEGRWDLRGISLDIPLPKQIQLPGGGIFDVPRVHNLEIFRKLQFRDIDFSYSNFSGAYFENCLFENILFREANGYTVNDSGSIFHNVDFSKAAWRGATLGLDGAQYEQVNFQQTDLRGAYGYRGYFIDCDFSKAKLVDIDFKASHFIRCKFKGKLDKIRFNRYYLNVSDENQYGKTDPNPMEDIDFSEAEFWEVTFTGDIDLSRVTPPEDGKHALFRDWPGALNVAKREVEEKWEGLFRERALDDILLFSGTKRTMNIANLVEMEGLVRKYFPDPNSASEYAQKFLSLLLRSAKLEIPSSA